MNHALPARTALLRAPRFWLAALLVLLAVLPAPALPAQPAGQTGQTSETIEAFVREGCPHCAKAEEFLAQLGRERPQLVIRIRDVSKEPAAMERLQQLVREVGGVPRVPAIWVGGQLITGYSPEASTDKLILAALAGQRAAAPHVAGAAGSCEADEAALAPAPRPTLPSARRRPNRSRSASSAAR